MYDRCIHHATNPDCRASPRRLGAARTPGALQPAAKPGRRKFATPRTAGRPLKTSAQGLGGVAAAAAGPSHLGGQGAQQGPRVVLHDLKGTLLQRLLAAPDTAAGADASAAGAAPAPAAAAALAAPLPLESAAAADYRLAAPEEECGGGGGSVGWEELHSHLLAAGAEARYVSPAWARNHFRWVVWKLARLELQRRLASGGGGGGPAEGEAAARPPLLTPAVVLDQLKYR